MILTGKRIPTVHQALCIARGLKLSAEETKYLETLALRDSAKNDWEIAYYNKQIKVQKKDLKTINVNTSSKDLIADPLILQILVYLLEMKNLDPHFTLEQETEKMAQRFGLEENRLKSILVNIKRAGLLESEVGSGFHVVFDKMNHKEMQKKHLKNLMNLASKKMDSDYENPYSHFTGFTFTASPENLLNLQSDLRSLMQKYLSEKHEDLSGRKIAQACFQVFPVFDY